MKAHICDSSFQCLPTLQIIFIIIFNAQIHLSNDSKHLDSYSLYLLTEVD